MSLNAIETERRGLAPWLAALAIGAVVLFAPQVLNDPDTYWHLAAGQWMLDHGRVPQVDVFSSSSPGIPWVAHEWLSEVLMALAWRAGGWAGLLGLMAAAVGSTAWLLVERLSRSLSGVTLLLVAVLGFGCMAPSLLARPQLLMLPVLVVWTREMMQARHERRAPHLAMALLMVLWANLHGSYVFGFLVAGAFGLDALLEERERRWSATRDWGLFGLAAFVAALITPNGLAGLSYPFQVMGMTSLPNILEWRAEDFSQPSVFELALFATLFVCLSRGVRMRIAPLLLLLGLLYMSLQHSRHQLVLAALAPLILAEPLAQALGQKSSGAHIRPALLVSGLAAAGLLLAARLALPITRTDGPETPTTALAHVPPSLAAQPVFNDYDFGGYLIFKGVRPFIDGRSDMYGDAFTQAYFQAIKPDPQLLASLLQRHRVAWSLMAPANPAVAVLDRAGWRRLYADRYAVVQQRPSQTERPLNIPPTPAR